MLDAAEGRPHRSLNSFAEAQRHKDAALIMEGDFGGQIYLTCPVAHVKCDESSLRLLFDDIVALSPFEGTGLYFAVAPPSTAIAGGMGGGIVLGGPWIHAEFVDAGIASGIRDVISGRFPDLVAAIPPNTIISAKHTFFQYVLESYAENLAIRCLKSGGDPARQDREGQTPLHRAASHGFVQLDTMLIDIGISPDIRDPNGRTPLHQAASWGRTELAKLLVARGADKCPESRFGLPSTEARRYVGEEYELSILLKEWERHSPPCRG
jgi:hypothetical protein